MYGVKAYVSAMREEFKLLRMRGNKAQVKEEIARKKGEIDRLLHSMKDSFQEIGRRLQREYREDMAEVNTHKDAIRDILGFEDGVRGFDLEFMTDDSLEALDIYQQFLGEEEYTRLKQNYQKTLAVMGDLYLLELDREKLKLLPDTSFPGESL